MISESRDDIMILSLNKSDVQGMEVHVSTQYPWPVSSSHLFWVGEKESLLAILGLGQGHTEAFFFFFCLLRSQSSPT